MLKKSFRFILATIIALTSFSSCSVYTQAHGADDVYIQTGNVDYVTVVTYGTPYYIDGLVSYYFYNGWYYYPYMWHDCYYLYPYRHKQYHGFVYHPPVNHKPYTHYRRPDGFSGHHDRHPKPGYTGHGNQHHGGQYHGTSSRPNTYNPGTTHQHNPGFSGGGNRTGGTYYNPGNRTGGAQPGVRTPYRPQTSNPGGGGYRGGQPSRSFSGGQRTRK